MTNVYADLGQLLALTTVVQPRLTAALMGMLVRGMGANHVVWRIGRRNRRYGYVVRA